MGLAERFADRKATKTFDEGMPFTTRNAWRFLRDCCGVELTEDQNMFADFGFQSFGDPLATVEYFLAKAGVAYADGTTDAALLHRAMTTSDLPSVLHEAAEHLILNAFRAAPATYRAWSIPATVRDFRTVTMTGLAFSGFEPVSEGADYPQLKGRFAYGAGALKSFGGQFSISYESYLEGRMTQIRDGARLLGRAAAMKTNSEAYVALLSNPRLSDGQVLFSEARGTLVTGGVMNMANVSACCDALRAQTDPAGNVLNLSPAALLVPPKLEMEARSLCRSVNDSQNPFELSLVPVVEPLIAAENGGSDADFYLCARPEDAAAFAQLALNPKGEPGLNTKADFKTDTIRWAARIDTAFVVKSAIGMIKFESE